MTVLQDKPARIDWMDGLRGTAIILVLLLHMSEVPFRVGYELPPAVAAVNHFFVPFRMQLLMFLSGMLLHRSLNKPPGIYYAGKLRTLVWPYIIWTAVILAIIRPDWHPIYDPRLWIATDYMWFLFYVTCFYVAAPSFRRLPSWLVPAVTLAASLPLHDGKPKLFLYYATFFFLGNVASTYRDKFDLLLSNRWCVAISGLLGLAVGVYSSSVHIEGRGEFILGSVGGVVFAIYAFQKFAAQDWLRPVRFIGRTSLIFYVAHYPAMFLTALLMHAAGVTSAGVVAVSILIVGAGSSAGLALARNIPPVKWLFVGPAMIARWGTRLHTQTRSRS